MAKKQRFTIQKVNPVAGTKSTWAKTNEVGPDTKYELLDDGYVYSRYNTEEGAEAAAAEILAEEKANVVNKARELESELSDTSLAKTATGQALADALAEFIRANR